MAPFEEGRRRRRDDGDAGGHVVIL